MGSVTGAESSSQSDYSRFSSSQSTFFCDFRLRPFAFIDPLNGLLKNESQYFVLSFSLERTFLTLPFLSNILTS